MFLQSALLYTGMGFAHRKISKLITSWEDISLDGDTWIIHIHTSVRQGTHRYKVGEHCDETTLDGRQVRVSHKYAGVCIDICLNFYTMIIKWSSREATPLGVWCQNDVVLTSMRHHFYVMSSLGQSISGAYKTLVECLLDNFWYDFVQKFHKVIP